jgi:hypothetical protein
MKIIFNLGYWDLLLGDETFYTLGLRTKPSLDPVGRVS